MRYGIVGTSWITESFIAGAALAGGMELAAVYSRSAQRAEAFAKKHGAALTFTSLEEMATCAAIDAVYIASPNVFHAPQSRLFLEHDKHVLCEKPATVTAVQARELLALASDPIGTRPGERVEVEPSTGHSIALSVLVFALPCVFLALGYILGKALGMGDLPSVGMAGIGLIVGFLPAVWVNRAITRRQTPEFVILKHLA